jgi:hypothetical protein
MYKQGEKKLQIRCDWSLANALQGHKFRGTQRWIIFKVEEKPGMVGDEEDEYPEESDDEDDEDEVVDLNSIIDFGSDYENPGEIEDLVGLEILVDLEDLEDTEDLEVTEDDYGFEIITRG